MRDFEHNSGSDGRRAFAYAAVMSGKIDRRWVLAVCAALALSLSPGPSAAADTNTEPSLASRLGEIAGSVYDTAQSHIFAPSRQAAEALLAHLRTQEFYRELSDAAQGLGALADIHVLQPMSRESDELIGRSDLRQWYEKVKAIAGDLAEKLRLAVLDPVIEGLRRAERALTPPPASSSAAAAAQALAIPGLPDSDILRNLNGNDPLEPFNRLMFRLNGGVQSKVLGPASQLYLDHASAGVQLGVGNFFRNLREPATFVSSALEGQFDDAGSAAARFGINTTLGIAGFRDPATELGYTVRPRNIEETLCTYELPSGPYLVLPILGPATLRDAAGRIATVVMYFEVMGAAVYVPYRITDFTVQYAAAKEKLDIINTLSSDPYTAQKALYLAMRDLGCGGQTTIHREFFAR
jgi:phospholipid-binding lipoprotein MlaA